MKIKNNTFGYSVIMKFIISSQVWKDSIQIYLGIWEHFDKSPNILEKTLICFPAKSYMGTSTSLSYVFG